MNKKAAGLDGSGNRSRRSPRNRWKINSQCRFFANGNCSKGANCRFSHETICSTTSVCGLCLRPGAQNSNDISGIRGRDELRQRYENSLIDGLSVFVRTSRRPPPQLEPETGARRCDGYLQGPACTRPLLPLLRYSVGIQYPAGRLLQQEHIRPTCASYYYPSTTCINGCGVGAYIQFLINGKSRVLLSDASQDMGSESLSFLGINLLERALRWMLYS